LILMGRFRMDALANLYILSYLYDDNYKHYDDDLIWEYLN